MTTDEIRAELQAAIRSDKRAAAILRKIAAGKASFTDTMNYSLISGRLTGQQLSAVILELSEGREELAEALLHDRYEDINAQCAAVQTSLDEKNGLHLAPQKAPFPADRVAKFVHSLVDPTVKDETIERRARSASENITVTFHDDFIAENAEFRDRAGVECFVERITDGSCCPWCNKVAGRYRMQDQPEGLFSRHDNCGCTIIYDGQVLRGQIGANGRRGRRWVEQPPKVEYQKPTVLSRSEAERLQAEKLPRRLTGGSERAIIVSGAISGGLNPDSEKAQEHAEKYYESVRHMKTDVRRIANNTGFSEEDVQKIKNHVFMEKHDLGNGEPEYFYPDYSMAQSWQRLIDGKNIQPHDITLLNHEIMERQLMEQGYSQVEAHSITEKLYNYAKESRDYYAEIKKHKNLR